LVSKKAVLLSIVIIVLGIAIFFAIDTLFGETQWAIVLLIIYGFTAALFIELYYHRIRQYKSKYL
jgi:hypothetical protein